MKLITNRELIRTVAERFAKTYAPYTPDFRTADGKKPTIATAKRS